MAQFFRSSVFQTECLTLRAVTNEASRVASAPGQNGTRMSPGANAARLAKSLVMPRARHKTVACVAAWLIVGLASCLNADQPQTDDAIRELVGRGAIIKRFEVREAETVGLLVRLKAGHLDAEGRVDPNIVDQLAKIPDLALELRSLPLSNEGLKALLQRTDPIGLDFSGSRVTNRGFASVAQAAKLRWLDVSFTSIGDDGLKSLTKLRELRHVSIMKCAISDAGLTHLESLRSLREIYLHETQVSDDGITRLQHRLPKCRIER